MSLDFKLMHHAMSDAKDLLHTNQFLLVNAEPETLAASEMWEGWKFPLTPDRVVIEITERASLEQLDLSLFQRHGVRLALDDFGTGMSNLRALEQVRPEYIKMNRDFLSTHNDDGVLAVMASQSTRWGTRLIAEGVEDESDISFLRQIGARYAQGFYLGKPKFADEYEGSRQEHVAHWN